MRHHHPSRQKGITLIGFMLMFVFFGFYVLLALKLGPIYLENFKVRSTLNALKKEPGLMDKLPREIISMVQKRWDVNDINRITADNSLVIEKHTGSVVIQLDYEVEEPVVGNVSALVKFKETVKLGESN